jgi:hypothetical protein
VKDCDEELFPVKGFEAQYAITKSGKVWSYPRKGRGGHNGKWMSPRPHSTGYRCVRFSANGVVVQISLQRLVATTFLPNPNNLPQVNHKNGIKTDNRVENLEWVTCSQNRQHAWDTGLRVVTEKMMAHIRRIQKGNGANL